jgi:hypothetical protein
VGFIGKGAPPPSIPLEGLATLDRAARSRALGPLPGFVAALGRAGAPEEHPFRGTTALDLQPTDLARLETELATAIGRDRRLLSEAARIAKILHFPPRRRCPTLRRLLPGFRRWRRNRPGPRH